MTVCAGRKENRRSPVSQSRNLLGQTSTTKNTLMPGHASRTSEMTIAHPSGMLSLLISTIVFFIASFFPHRYLENWELDKGRARKLLILAIATLISCGAVSLVGHITCKPSVRFQTTGVKNEPHRRVNHTNRRAGCG